MNFASASTTIKFHEFPNGNVVHNYQPGTKVEGPIRSISWSQDGNWLLLVPHSGFTEIVSIKEQLKLLKTIRDIDEPTCAKFLNASKKNIALGTKSGLIVIYDVKTRSTTKRFQRCSSQINHLEFAAKDTHFVAGCINGDVLLFNNIYNNPPTLLRVPKSNTVTSLKVNPLKRNLVVAGSNEGVVVVWDSNTNQEKFCVEAHNAPVNGVAFSPISELLVSVGSDRQCCFFDFADNKCVATVSVDNSITSVDFSPDGTYFTMGSQNGKVYLYDSRNIQDPINIFHAHKTSVKHIAFHHIQDNVDASSCSISSDNVPSTHALVTDQDTKTNRNSDLSGLFIPTADSSEDPKKSITSEGGDSFMFALGLNRNNTEGSLKLDDSISLKCYPKLPTPLDNSSEDRNIPTPNSAKFLLDKSGFSEQKQFSSTPKFTFEQLKPQPLPNVSTNQVQTLSATDATDMKTTIKDCIKEEFDVVIAEIKKDIERQASNTISQLSGMLLDIQMKLVKEFIKLEHLMNRLSFEVRNCSLADYEAHLLEENEQLKQEVEILKNDIKNLNNMEDDSN